VEVISRRIPSLARPAAYFGYGLWNNFGLRKPFRVFADRWIFPMKHNGRKNPRTIRIHLDGEVYMRTSQAEAVLNLLIDHLGIGAFEMTMTPTWCFFEAMLFTRVLDAQGQLADLGEETGDLPADRILREKGKTHQMRIIRESEQAIHHMRNQIARPMYDAAGILMPHPIREIYSAAAPIIPTGKPHGELAPFVGESVLRCREGVDLILNVSPQGRLGSGMGEMLIPSILEQAKATGATIIASLYSQDGEVDEDQLRLALLKSLGDRWGGVLPADAP
jgi:hypothetical protein